jgi:hypothetical protein
VGLDGLGRQPVQHHRRPSRGRTGSAAALRIKSQNNGANLRWAATDYVFQTGSFLT